MLIAVLNQSTLVKSNDVSLMARACATQIKMHAAPAWDRNPAAVVFYEAKGMVPPGASIITVLDDADQAGALGWHTEARGGVVYGRVFARPVIKAGGDALTRPLSVASVLSHEVVELFVDPNVNLWADDGTGKQAFAVEACDPVEADSYVVGVDGINVTVSNFVTPAWFDRQAGPHARFDWLGKVRRPFTMSSGGYVVLETEGKVTQKFGEEYPEWRRGTKGDPLARTSRRVEQSAA